jgi:TonB family protein
MFRSVLLAGYFIVAIVSTAFAQELRHVPRVAVLDFGEGTLHSAAAETVATSLKKSNVLILDRDQTRAAAAGIGYTGSLNLERTYARDLGAALGCEFYLIVDARTLRRSRSDKPAYFEAYASLFLVSARTGRLVNWDRSSFEAQNEKDGEEKLLGALAGLEVNHRINLQIRRALEDESVERASVERATDAIIEDAGDEQIAEANGLRPPRAFRRLRPTYPESAAQADAEATVDALADIDANGDVTRVEIVRWAGFGLDQATIDTVRQLKFFPAQRNGSAVPIRVLLRYNFRKPPRTEDSSLKK